MRYANILAAAKTDGRRFLYFQLNRVTVDPMKHHVDQISPERGSTNVNIELFRFVKLLHVFRLDFL